MGPEKPAELPGGPGGEACTATGFKDPRVVQGDQHDLLIV